VHVLPEGMTSWHVPPFKHGLLVSHVGSSGMTGRYRAFNTISIDTIVRDDIGAGILP